MITHTIMETTQWDVHQRCYHDTYRAVVRSDGETLYIGEMRRYKSEALLDAQQFMVGISEGV